MFLNEVEKYMEDRKEYNLKKFGAEYISYNPELVEFEGGESTGYSDKVLRIPSACFMTIEYCEPFIDEITQARQYRLATYSPGKMPHLQKCMTFLGAEEDDELHRHEYFEMIYVYKGHRTTMIENQEVVLKEKELCIFDMQCAHLDIRSQSEGIAFYCCFTSQQVDSFFLNNLSDQSMKKFFLMKGLGDVEAGYLKIGLEVNVLQDIEKLFGQIFLEVEEEQIGCKRITQTYLLRLLNKIKLGNEKGVYVHTKKLRGTKLYQAVSRYISSNIADISLEKLCNEFHYQADYYNRLIKKNTGLTYSEYLKKMRMDKAKNLLINTNMSVQDILSYVGYQCHSYFYKSFYEETGLTPAEYRKNHNKAQ